MLDDQDLIEFHAGFPFISLRSIQIQAVAVEVYRDAGAVLGSNDDVTTALATIADRQKVGVRTMRPMRHRQKTRTCGNGFVENLQS